MARPHSHSILDPAPAGPDLEHVVCDYCGDDRTHQLATLPPPDALPSPMHRLGISALDLSGGPVAFVRCAQCGLVYMNPRLTEPAIARFYDTVYSVRGAASAFEDTQHARVAYLLDHAESLLDTPAHPPAVLDIGCGAGQFLHAAQQRGWTVLGSELSAVAVERASQCLGVPIHHGDFREMGITPASLDVVTMLSVVEHLRAPVDFLRDSAALLRPGGVLLFNVPNTASWEYRAARRLGQTWRGFIVEHLYYFDPPFLERLLDELGFTIGRMTSWKPGAAFPNPLRDAWHLLAQRRATPAPAAPVPPPGPAIPPARPVSLMRRIGRQANNLLLDGIAALSDGTQTAPRSSGSALFVWAVKR